MTPRTSKDPNKLKHVELVNGRWVYRPYIPKNKRDGLQVDAKGRIKPIRLGSASDPRHKIVAAYAAAVKLLEVGSDSDRFTLRWMDARYRKSREFKELSASSQKKAATLRKALDHKITLAGKPATLGDLRHNELTTAIINRIIEKRLSALQKAGKKGTVHVNREMTYLAGVVSWAKGMYDEIKDNPFVGRNRIKEEPSDRYVTDAEYEIQYRIASEMSDYLPVVFELAYLLASRGCEAISLKITDIRKDRQGNPAIYVSRTKGSINNFIQITPRIQAAIDAAMALHRTRKVSGVYLVPGPRSARLTQGTLQSRMQDLRGVMKERGITSRWTRKGGQNEHESPLYWTLHALKKKGVTDADDNRIAGHKTDRIREEYTVQAASFKPPK